MGKKRGKDKTLREEDDIDLTVISCRHIKRGTEQTLLKKLSGISDWMSCQDCKHDENKENISSTLPQDTEEEETVGIWMCLKCGHRGCGRNSEDKHAIKHYETPRSDPHCLVVSLDNWSVWCYICDDEVQYSRTGHLAQLLTNLKKQTSACSIKTGEKSVKEEVEELESQQKTETVNTEQSENKELKERTQKKNTKKESAGKAPNFDAPEEKGGVPVKGLSNLGNTCFFNAVIQSLSQTHLLRQTLNKVTEEKRTVDIKPAASVDLEPLVVQLNQAGPLTLAMCQLLNEIQESKKGVVTPRELFTQVCKKASRFKGFQQQDSQELLRYLLDGMRAEELKRINTGLMEALKQSSKNVDEEALKKMAKEYEKNGCPGNIVDQVFGGEMTSTIMCQQCKTVSVVTEMFLDLSLPVSDEAYRKKNQKKGVPKSSESVQDGRNSPASTSGNDETSSGVGSKYQQKKAKKQAKKQAKQQKRQQKLGSRVTLDSLSSSGQADSDHTDADAEEMAENTDKQANKEACEQSPPPADVSEPDQSAEQEEKEDSSGSSQVNNRFTVLSEQQDSLCDEMSSLDQEGEEDTQLVSKMERVTLDDAFIQDSEDMGSEDEPPEAKEYTVTNQDPELAFHTLATRASPEKQECSIQSCLFQFTEVETLTQNNSLLCVSCTKRQPREDKAAGSKKNIYTDALKQMLISSPPAVLTLHLKRFQQNGYSICKVNRHVQFPLILDLAPFCSAKCKNVSDGDTQILYSLYGIVEHSGTMRSGHYTAYVKVRPESPKAPSNKLSTQDDVEPPGRWFHISDTSVQPASESKVQSCQAYLLFYERIL